MIKQERSLKMSNRFGDNLNEDFGITLLKFSYNGTEFSIRATDHSLFRFKQNRINMDLIIADIISLGKDRLYKYSNQNDDVAIIDKNNHLIIILVFCKNQIRIATIITRPNAIIKEHTLIYNLYSGIENPRKRVN
jgi:hypothetical protein